jgi:F-type H+-transporting ATPase subunit alpha
LKQPQLSPMPMEEQVCSIFAGVNGYLDAIKVSDVQRFEREFLEELREKGADILKAIRDSGDLDAETEKKLRAFLDGFAKTFV